MKRKTLHLPVKAEYFYQIQSGAKTEEFRLVTPYWTKRIEGKDFDQIEIILGYPAKADTERRMKRPWRGYRRTTITHPEFGPELVEVYAIRIDQGEPQ
ncbi:ASCH domain-containing protein [Roseovarius sp. D0-M9]|uniref:ASCH domain-containing protein n=1 Tax=Roseovarius sp. D0-M9 TaxID=3127117 RepID=UPI00300F9A82